MLKPCYPFSNPLIINVVQAVLMGMGWRFEALGVNK